MIDLDEAVDRLVESGMCDTTEKAMEVVGSSCMDRLAMLMEQANYLMDDNIVACYKCDKCDEDEDDDGCIGFKCTELDVYVNEHEFSIREDCPLN